MKIVTSRFLLPLLIAGIVFGQRPSENSNLLAGLMQQPTDKSAIQQGLALLDSPDPKPAINAMRAWDSMFNEVSIKVSDKRNDASADEDAVAQKKYDELSDFLQTTFLSKLETLARSPYEEVRLQALRSLCLLTTKANEVFDRPIWSCGFGYSMTMEYKVSAVFQRLLPNSKPDLTKLLHDSSPDVVYNARRALELPFSPREVPMIKALLQDSRKDHRALGFRMLEKAPFKVQIELLAFDIGPLNWREASASQNVIRGTDEDYLQLALSTSSPANLRAFAIERFPYDSEKTITILAGLIGDSDAKVRRTALSRLFSEQQKRSFEPYMYLLDDPSPEVRGEALTIAAGQMLPGLLPHLKAAVESSSPELQESAVYAAEDIQGSEVFTEALLDIVEKSDEGTFGYDPPLRDPRYKHLVQRCARSGSSSLRLIALRFLTHPKSDLEFDLLNQLANDEDSRIACRAAQIMLTFDTEKAIQIIKRIVSTPDMEAGYFEASVLLESKSRSAMHVLEMMANSENSQTRFQGKRFLVDLKKALNP